MERLTELALKAMRSAYAPYSRFRVGAAIEADSGEVFVGCNVENASYGLTICAERAALAAAVAQGDRRFRRIVVATEGDRAVAPCGACRQVLAEFGERLEVHGVAGSDRKRWVLGELLPATFGAEALAEREGAAGPAPPTSLAPPERGR